MRNLLDFPLTKEEVLNELNSRLKELTTFDDPMKAPIGDIRPLIYREVISLVKKIEEQPKNSLRDVVIDDIFNTVFKKAQAIGFSHTEEIDWNDYSDQE